MKFLLIIISLCCFAQTSYSLTANKENHFFKNGFNSPVYGEIFFTNSTDSADLTGFKFGVQFVRVSDVLSMTLGGSYASSDGTAARDIFGPVFEAIIFPEYFINGGLSYTSSKGSIEPVFAEGVIVPEDTKRFLYKTTEIGVNLMFNVSNQVNIVLGYVINSATTTEEGNETSEDFNSFLIGLRGSAL